MSEGFEAYYLRSPSRQPAIDLLLRAGIDGLVLPASNGWIGICADGTPFTPNERLIAANEVRLLHVWCYTEAGWGFTSFRGAAADVAYSFDLEDRAVTTAVNLDWEHLATAFDLAPHDEVKRDAILASLSPPNASHFRIGDMVAAFFGQLGTQPPIGITYDGLRRQMSRRIGPPIVGATAVIDGTVRFDESVIPAAEPSAANAISSHDAPDPRLIGTWVPVRSTTQSGTRDIPLSDQTRRFETDQVIVTNVGARARTFVSNYTVRLDCDPAEIDIVEVGREFSVAGIQGIYRVDGNEMTWCWGFARDPRPRQFKASKEPWYQVDTYRRV